MLYINQLELTSKPVEQNKEFFRLLSESEDLIEVTKKFDCLNCYVSTKIQPDHEMTLEKFIELLDEQTLTTLTVNSPRPDKIIYTASLYHPGDMRRHACIEMPYNPKNFSILSKLYTQAFDSQIRSEPVQE